MTSGAGHSTRRILTRIGMEPISPVRAVAGKERVPHLRRSGIYFAPRTQRLRTGLTSAAPTALKKQPPIKPRRIRLPPRAVLLLSARGATHVSPARKRWVRKAKRTSAVGAPHA